MTPADLFDLMAELKRANRVFCVLTVVRTQDATSAKAGAKALITADGEFFGHLGGACVANAVRAAAAEAVATGEPRLIRVKPVTGAPTQLDADGVELHKSGCPSGGTVDIFVEPHREPPAIVICGAGPVAGALGRLGRALGYRILHAAAVEDHAAVSDPDKAIDGFDLQALDVTAGDFVVIAAQGKRDLDALEGAVRSPADYIAMVASRRKAETLRKRLLDRGLSPDLLARVRSPAGLDLGAIEPEEIALSIVAEIVRVRRRGADALLTRTGTDSRST